MHKLPVHACLCSALLYAMTGSACMCGATPPAFLTFCSSVTSFLPHHHLHLPISQAPCQHAFHLHCLPPLPPPCVQPSLLCQALLILLLYVVTDACSSDLVKDRRGRCDARHFPTACITCHLWTFVENSPVNKTILAFPHSPELLVVAVI